MYKLEHEYPESTWRINEKSHTYFSIVYKQFVNNLNEIEKSDFNDIDQLQQQKWTLYDDYHVITVFSVMTIETFVNDYLAVCLTDDFYYSNLDKLNILQKIEILFSLVWKEPIDKSKVLYKYLKDIIKERNQFVHTKSRSFDYTNYIETQEIKTLSYTDLDDYESQLRLHLQEDILDFLQEAFVSIKTIYLFMKTVDEHDKNRHAIISTMNCMEKEETLIGNQIVIAIEKQIGTIEKRIKTLKKRINN